MMNKILVIDNEFEIIEVISEMLSIHGYQTKTAINGREGISAASKFNPDLILCDISMPEISGYEVLKSIRNNTKTYAIPFIFLTAKGDMKDLRKGMLMGADDYLTKPVSAEDLIAAVQTRLEKHNQITRQYKNEIEQTRYDLEITKNYDSLTGLPKQNVLEKKLKQLSPGSHSGRLTALLIIKFNRFRNITDIFGQKVARPLVKELISRIQTVSGEEKNIYYIDDGEFGVLQLDVIDKNALIQTAKKILVKVRKPIELENKELNCSACIGIAYITDDTVESTALIQDAELALNAALEAGFNTYHFYEEDLKKHAYDQINIENALHKALEKNEFKIYYQPKIDSANKTIIGSEALIRWDNSDYGMLSPKQFVPMAEENGLIVPIGEWVLESICNQLNQWKSRGLDPAPVAINISARQLEQKNFVKSITTILEKTNVENKLLEIELTESILIKNSQKNSRKLTRLRKKGMKVAIDDFGTGYSSLSYLSNFPFDKLKIDQSFIRDITTDKAAASLATSIISMAHSLGVRVIAEGVETEEQLNFLKDYDCDEIQGYYYSKPIPAEDFTKLLKEKTIPV